MLQSKQAIAQDPFDLLFGAEPETVDASGQRQTGADDLLILGLSLRKLKLLKDMEAYQIQSGVCLDPVVILNSMTFFSKSEDESLSGWTLSPEQTFEIDYSVGRLQLKEKAIEFPNDWYQKTKNGWCMSLEGLMSFLPIDFTYNASEQLVVMEPREILPIEARLEREALRASLKPNKEIVDPNYPRIENPYRWLSFPAADISVSASLDGSGLSKSINLDLAGDFLKTTGRLRTVSSETAMIDGFRFSLERKSSVPQSVGFMPITDLRIGDIYAPSQPLIANSRAGRGIYISNRPLFAADTFDMTSVYGALPQGWEAELYDNDTLIAFVNEPDSQGSYVFEDVALRVGYNRLVVKLYGPHGEYKERIIKKFVGSDQMPENEFRYTLGVLQKDISLFGDDLKTGSETVTSETESQNQSLMAHIAGEYGVSNRLSVRVDGLLGEEKSQNMGAVTLYGSALDTYGMLRFASNGTGRPAAEIGLQRRVPGGGNFSASLIDFGGLRSDISGEGVNRLQNKANMRLQMPVTIAGMGLNTQSRANYEKFENGNVNIEASNRFSTRIGALRLSHTAKYRVSKAKNDEANKNLSGELLLSRRLQAFRVKSALAYDISDGVKLNSVALGAQKRVSNNGNFQASLTHTLASQKTNLDLGYAHSFDKFIASGFAGLDNQGDWRIGAQISFSLFAGDKGLSVARPGIARTGAFSAHVFDDVDGDGVYSNGDVNAKGVEFIVDNSLRSEQTDDSGTVSYSGIENFRKINLELKQSTLDDPYLRPITLSKATSLRPGQVINVDFPLNVRGEVDGTIQTINRGIELPVSGVRVEAIDTNGIVVETAITEFDGYYYFSNLPASQVQLRIHADDLETSGGKSKPRMLTLTRDEPALYDVNLTIHIKDI